MLRLSVLVVALVSAAALAGLLDDPTIYAATRRIVLNTRRVLESHPEAYLKRAGRQAPAQFLRIGQLSTTSGPSSSYSILQMNAWTLWLARNPTLTINGLVYGIQLIVYVDGSSPPDPPDTTMALSEWLVTHDLVHILSTGMNQGDSYGMENVAEILGVPCINSGDYYASFSPPKVWSLYMLPRLQLVGVACSQALIAAGAKTFVEVADPTGFLQTFYEPAITSLGGTILAKFNTTPEMRADPTGALYDPIIEQLIKLNPDVLMGSATENLDPIGTELAFMNRMHSKGYTPSAVLSWTIGSYPGYRVNGTWQVAGQMIGEGYQPSLNQTDPVWGSSLQYDAAYRVMFGYPTSNNDAALAGSITMLVVGLNNSNINLSSPAAVLAALSSVNTNSIFGPLFFNGTTLVQRPIYCFQNTFPNASNVVAVWPPTSSSFIPIVYPAKAVFPSGYLDQFKTTADSTVRNILLGIFIPLGGIIVTIAVVLLVVWWRYDAIFIPKDKMNPEWGSQS